MLDLKKKLAFRGKPELKNVRYLATINANIAPLVFVYTGTDKKEHVTQRPESGKVGFTADPFDIVNVTEERTEYRTVSAITGGIGSAFPTLAAANATVWDNDKTLGYLVTTFVDEKPTSVQFFKYSGGAA